MLARHYICYTHCLFTVYVLFLNQHNFLVPTYVRSRLGLVTLYVTVQNLIKAQLNLVKLRALFYSSTEICFLHVCKKVIKCDSGWDFVPYGGFTNNPVQVVFVENVKLMYFWLIASR